MSIHEARLAGTGKEELAGGYQLHWSGPPTAAHHAGVALLLSPAAAGALLSCEAVSPRMMLASFAGAVTISVLAFYAPHTSRPAAERAEFRAALQRVRHSVNEHKCYIELGDANAKVGTAQASGTYGGALGTRGTGTQKRPGGSSWMTV